MPMPKSDDSPYDSVSIEQHLESRYKYILIRRWDILKKEDLDQAILSESFLEPWCTFRDSLPLIPGAKVEFCDNRFSLATSFTERIYEAMYSMATCEWDRPTEAEKIKWLPLDHFLCLVYQVTSNLARKGDIFYSRFLILKNIHGRKIAKGCIIAINMLAYNLVHYYTTTSGGIRPIVANVEAKRPAADPSKSPIPLVRRKHAIENMDVEELRKAVLDKQRQGKNERQFLLKRMLEESEDEHIAEGDMQAAGGKGKKRKI